MNLIHDDLEDYCSHVSSDEPEVLKQLAAYTEANHTGAIMLSGAYQGRLLSLISKMVRPVNVLEIGTYTGYSAICFSEGLPDGGLVHTIEIDPALENTHQLFIGQSPYKEKIRVYYGDAKAIIPQMNLSFDLVFLDGAKQDYEVLLEPILNKMNPGAILLADNVLWKGKVADRSNDEKNTVALRRFNEKVYASDRVEKFLLPVRDGLFMIRKKT